MLRSKMGVFLTIGLGMLWVGVLVSGAAGGETATGARTDGLRAVMGEELRDDGVEPIAETGEGKLVRVRRGREFGWVVRKSDRRHGAYFYFDVDQGEFTEWAGGRAVRVRVSYFDGGDGSFSLVYDSFDRGFRLNRNVPPGAWRPALRVELEGSGAWKTAEAAMPYPYFQDRLNRYDIRINPPARNEQFAVREVALVRTDEPARTIEATASVPVGIKDAQGLSVRGSYVRQVSHFLPDEDGNVWMEAEEAAGLELQAGKTVGLDPGASGGAYVHFVDSLKATFTMEEAGTYRAWERGYYPHAGHWNHAEHMEGGEGHTVTDHKGASDGWVWVKGPVYDLEAGENTWVFDGYHAGARLDKLVLSPVETFQPKGAGGHCVRRDPPERGRVVSSVVRPLDVKRWVRLRGEVAVRWGTTGGRGIDGSGITGERIEGRGIGGRGITDKRIEGRGIDGRGIEGERTEGRGIGGRGIGRRAVRVEYRTGGGEWRGLPAGGDLSGIETVGGGEDALQFRFLLQASPDGALPFVQGLEVEFVPGAGDAIELGNDRIALRFDSAGLAGIRDVRAGRRLTKKGVHSPLFGLSVKEPGAHSPTPLPFSKAVIEEREKTGDGLRIRYRYPEGIGVDFIAELNEDGTCTWRLGIDNGSDQEVCAVSFPKINGLRAGFEHADDTLLWPVAWGQIWRNPVACNLPSKLGPMLRFVDLYDGETAFYLANYDRELYHTSYSFPNYDTSSLTAAWTRYVTVKPGDKFEGLETCIGAHRGDWHYAADRYREWAEAWMEEPPVPPWAVEVHGWGTYDSNRMPREGLATFRHFQRNSARGLDRYLAGNRFQLEGPIQYVGLMHGLCPLWGSEEQWAEQCRDVREHGGHVNTYFNWYRFSPQRVANKRLSGFIPRSWMPEDVWYPDVEWYRENTIRDYTGGSRPVGTIETELPMCVGSEGWRRWQMQWLRRYVEKYRTDGMYYDQIMKAPATCRWSGHEHEHIGNFRRSTLETLRAMNREMRKKNPHFALSGELCSGVIGQEIPFHMVSAVLNRTEVFRYTFPDYIVLDGKWNGGTKDWLGGEDRYHHIYLTGCRFEQIPGGEFGDQLMALREKVGQMLYRARYLDTVGLTLRDADGQEIPNPGRTREKGREIAPVGGLQAKLLRYTGRENRVLLVNVTNGPGIEGTIEVDSSGIGEVRAAWLYTLDGEFRRIEGEQEDGVYSFPAPKARLATAVLVNRVEPIVQVEMEVPHVAGMDAEAVVRVVNLNAEPLEGELEWELPGGWAGGEARAFGIGRDRRRRGKRSPTASGLAPGESVEVGMSFQVPEDAEVGRPFVFLRASAAGPERGTGSAGRIRKFVPFSVVDPLRVYVREDGNWGLVAAVANRGTSPLSGRVRVEAPEGLVDGDVTAPFTVEAREETEVRFRFDRARRIAVPGRLDVRVAAQARQERDERPFRLVPTLPNPSFEEDSAGDGRPDHWLGSTGTHGGTRGVAERWKEIHLDGQIRTDGEVSARIDPYGGGEKMALYNLIGRMPGPGTFRLSMDVRREARGRARVHVRSAGIGRHGRMKVPAETGKWHTLRAEWAFEREQAGWFSVMVENQTEGAVWVDNVRLEVVE